jgi:hypothetical protein
MKCLHKHVIIAEQGGVDDYPTTTSAPDVEDMVIGISEEAVSKCKLTCSYWLRYCIPGASCWNDSIQSGVLSAISWIPYEP